MTVVKWRKRVRELGLDGLHDELWPDGRTSDDDTVAEETNGALQIKPADGRIHWIVRVLSAATAISKITVFRWLQTFTVQPHRQKHFKLPTNPLFVERVRDIVGLCLNPPERAMVLCVDQQSQIQALDRTQQLLPMGLGNVEVVTHDTIRHGNTALFSALVVAIGEVITQCKTRHRHQISLGIPRQIKKSVTGGWRS